LATLVARRVHGVLLRVVEPLSALAQEVSRDA
jgi:hypothetical protein